MTVRDELQAIYAEHGMLTPALVLSEATNPDHPLHGRFTWVDSEAAEKWRLHQASALIRSVKVVIERPTDREPIAVRAFVSESEIGRGSDEAESDFGAYLPVETVVGSEVLRTAWFRALARDWQALKRRAGDSKEFADMVLGDLRGEVG